MGKAMLGGFKQKRTLSDILAEKIYQNNWVKTLSLSLSLSALSFSFSLTLRICEKSFFFCSSKAKKE